MNTSTGHLIYRSISCCRCRQSPHHNFSPLGKNNLQKRDKHAKMIHYSHYLGSDGSRRKLLNCGRARRKLLLKQAQATHKVKHEDSINSVTATDKKTIPSPSNDNEQENNISSKSPSEILFGAPMSNPIRERYIRSQQKINYPKTWSGWKEVFRKTKDIYVASFEGFLLPVKKRDENGNIIADDGLDTEEEDGDEKTTMKDQAKDAANEIANNVQKNIFTIQQEAPKLLKMGQQVTGISSKEELRTWVGEQLKLATACLTEFMKGYRSGRDDEVDKMLHEYFKDLDDQKEMTSESTNAVAEHQSESGDDKSHKRQERRLWGRKERRRAKAMSNNSYRAEAVSVGTNE